MLFIASSEAVGESSGVLSSLVFLCFGFQISFLPVVSPGRPHNVLERSGVLASCLLGA
jgi:hypothetical protein